MYWLYLFGGVIRFVIFVFDVFIVLVFLFKFVFVWLVFILYESEFVFGIKWNLNIGLEFYLLCLILMEVFCEVVDN